jgi:uncharacterized membrane protein SpoIIM required for sporulation
MEKGGFVIVDLERFIAAERQGWNQLETTLNRLEADPNLKMTLEEVQRFHELYEHAAANLAKLTTFSSEPQTRRYLESLVARAYGEIHETREKRRRIFPVKWFFRTLPQTFRRHIREFQLAVVVTLVGCVFGGLAAGMDPDSRYVTMPFGYDQLKPSERVKQEETRVVDRLAGEKPLFSAYLMRNNIQVSITTLSLGTTYGLGTLVVLFYNGVILGSIAYDYVSDGQTRFLLGWLMPHGVIEIPAILIAGQAGFVLAFAFIGWGKSNTLRERLRGVSRDTVTLAFGFAVLLVWAGFVEAFLSQYHEPVISYGSKIAFGSVELVLLCLYLAKSGR